MSSNNQNYEDAPSARDWKNGWKEGQYISPEYLKAVRESAAADEEDRYLDDREPGCGQIVIPLVTVLHEYSQLIYIKDHGKVVIPLCRPTEPGNFVMAGPEVFQIFAHAGKEEAYTVWLRLQYSDLMHHRNRGGVTFTGARGVLVRDLKKSFPTRSVRWVSEQLKTIENLVGMYKESRRDDLTGQSEGTAYYPYMTYRPAREAYEDVTGEEETMFDIQERRVKPSIKKAPADVEVGDGKAKSAPKPSSKAPGDGDRRAKAAHQRRSLSVVRDPEMASDINSIAELMRMPTDGERSTYRPAASE